MRVLKIGIRQQLIFLVLMVALLSLMVLAIITGVYFSANYKNIRADKLQVIAQLKASQVEQNLNYLYYQVYWLSGRDTIESSLVSYRAGNTTTNNFYNAADTVQQFLSSSNTFSYVRLYDSRFELVLNSSDYTTHGKHLPEDVLEELFPLDMENENSTLPANFDQDGLLTGPVANDTSFIMSMTLPIYASASILYDTTDLVGYLTTVMSADSLTYITNDSTAITNGAVEIIATNNTSKEISYNSTFYYALPSPNLPDWLIDTELPIKKSYIANQALRLNKTGSTSKTKLVSGNVVAAGYCPINFKMTRWAAIIEQPRSKFLEPSNRLAKIIVGVSIGTAVFMGLITFPLAHWAVQPIMRLQKATETIAAGRGLQTLNEKRRKDKDRDPSSGNNSSRASFNSSRSPVPYPSSNNGDGGGGGSGGHSHNLSSGTDNMISENGSMSSGVAGHSTYISNARVPHYTRFFQDELSKLTETFNAMTDELDRQYSHLEDRVKARTKQLEAAKIQAEAANEAKTVFIANISHELRTPLNGILGMTAIAMAETDPNKIQQSLKLIFRSGELLLHILTELLTFSKNSLKRSKLENSDFGVIEVALQIKSIFGKLAKDQNVNLTISLKPNNVRKMVLYGDSNRIIQVVMNLVSNSLKFTPVDGKVSVTIRNIGEYDEERSAREDYKHVYVKPNSIHHHSHNHSPEADEKLISVNGHNNNDISTSSNDTTTDDDDSDKKSVITVSTSSYDETVFKNQFKTNDEDDGNLKSRDLRDHKTWVFEFEVEDTGPGIEPKLQESVFEPFVQGDQTLSRQYGGTGLGLSICRQLATMMKGVMELKSTVGVGSKFIFRVPLIQRKELIIDENDLTFYEDEFNVNSKKNRKVKIVEPEKSPEPEQTSSNNSYDNSSREVLPGTPRVQTPTSGSNDNYGYFDRPILQSTGTAKPSSLYSYSSQGTTSNHHQPSKNLKILVAEDNIVNQEVIKRMLNLEGFTDVELAVDGEEAIGLVKSKRDCSNAHSNGDEYYDVIFMDVQMPKVDGLMATKHIRNELKYDNPIVALTAFADESNVKECLDAGMTGFLSKPIRRLQLRQVLTEYCPVILKDMVATPSEDAFKNSKNNSPKSVKNTTASTSEENRDQANQEQEQKKE